MKKIFLAMLMIYSITSFAEVILVMDTIEWNTIRNDAGKDKYATGLTALLKKMRLKVGKFDAMDEHTDKEEVFALIQSPDRWPEIMKEIEKACKKPYSSEAAAKNCNALEKLRLDTFDYIKGHPQDYGDNGGVGEKTATH